MIFTESEKRERWRKNRWVTREGWKGAVWMWKCDLNQKHAVSASLWGSLSLQFCQQTALLVQSGSLFHFFKRRCWYYTGQGDKGSLSFSQGRPSVRPCACLCVCVVQKDIVWASNHPKPSFSHVCVHSCWPPSQPQTGPDHNLRWRQLQRHKNEWRDCAQYCQYTAFQQAIKWV